MLFLAICFPFHPYNEWPASFRTSLFKDFAMDCAGKVKRRRRFERTGSVEVSTPRRADESGVTLRLPPQSKVANRNWTFSGIPNHTRIGIVFHTR
jgi:hypothetical protein